MYHGGTTRLKTSLKEIFRCKNTKNVCVHSSDVKSLVVNGDILEYYVDLWRILHCTLCVPRWDNKIENESERNIQMQKV